MYDFTYHSPQTLDEAVQIFTSNSDDAAFISGGMTLIPTMKQRLSTVSTIIDLGKIESLNGISLQGQSVVIGALTTHAQVAHDPLVRQHIPALAALAQEIGDPQVRNRGTIGGSVANSDPAADYPAAVLGLSATIHTNTREIPAQSFFTGLFETVLDDCEIITKIAFPIPVRAAYMKFANPASRYAIVGVFVAQGPGGIRVAVTGARSHVFRAEDFEKALENNWEASALSGLPAVSAENSDIHASADYRSHLIAVMAGRAVAASSH